MSKSAVDLAGLFNAALKSVTTNREQINELDGYNGDHGDNVVENLRMITEALRAKKSRPPAEALQYASEQLQASGQGGSSKYYAEGLRQAADQVEGKPKLESSDIVTLVQSLLNALPSEGYPEQVQSGDNVFEQIKKLAGEQQTQAKPQSGDVDVGQLISTLLPAGLAFMQTKQVGADDGSAALQALMRAFLGGGLNPLQTSSPRAAAGGLIAQSILKALLQGK